MNSYSGKVRAAFLIGVVLLFPNVFPAGPEAVAPQLASGALVVILVVIFGLTGRLRLPRTIVPIAAAITVYVMYVAIVTLIKSGVVIGNVTWFDLGEPLRATGMLISFGLAATYASRGEGSIAGALWLYIVIMTCLLIEWLWSLGWFGDFLSGLYFRREGRFSGLMPSVNYVWLPVLITIFLHEVAKTTHSTQLDWIRGLCVWTIGLLTLLLAGSRTSIAASMVGVVSYGVWWMGTWCHRLIRRGVGRVPKIREMIIGVGLVIVGVWYIGSTGAEGGFERGYGRIGEVATRGLGSVPALEKRQWAWRDLPAKIDGAWLVGRGPDSENISPGNYDNSFIVTIHRYGVVGLFIELGIMVSVCVTLLATYWRTGEEWCMVGVIMVVACTTAGLTSSVMYELKSPYLLFTWLGLACGFCANAYERRMNEGGNRFGG